MDRGVHTITPYTKGDMAGYSLRSGNGMAMASQAMRGLATLCGLANQMRDKQIFYSEANVFPQTDARDVMGEYT